MGSGASMSATSTVYAQLGQSQQPKFDGRISGTREDKINRRLYFPENRNSQYTYVVRTSLLLFFVVVRTSSNDEIDATVRFSVLASSAVEGVTSRAHERRNARGLVAGLGRLCSISSHVYWIVEHHSSSECAAVEHHEVQSVDTKFSGPQLAAC